MSIGLIVDDIIVNMIRNKELEYHREVFDSFFTKIKNKRIYMYRVSLQYFNGKKDTHESLDVPCVHFNFEIIQIRQYFTNILECDTSSDDMK